MLAWERKAIHAATTLSRKRKERQGKTKGRSNGKAAGNVLVYSLGFAQVKLFL